MDKDGTSIEMILGFVNNKMYMFTKVSSGGQVSVTYKPDEVKSYRIDGNKARYEGGTLTFTITGNSATFIQEDANGKTTLSVLRTNASAVEGAKPEDGGGSGDPGGPGGPSVSFQGYWKVTKREIINEQKIENFPLILENKDDNSRIQVDLYLGFIDSECRHYMRYTGLNEEGTAALESKGIISGQFYYTVQGHYTYDENTGTLKYMDISGNYEGDQPFVEMTFDGTRISQVGPGIDQMTIYVINDDGSILDGAIPKSAN